MKKKKRIIIILIVSFILFFVIGNLITYFTRKNKTYNNVNDFADVKELIEYYSCEYKKMKNSDEDGFKKDIYLKFSVDPIDENGNTKEAIYENIISLVSAKLNKQNFRMIDEDRNIIVRVLYYEDDTISYTINNMDDYFENLKSAYLVNNAQETKITQSNIESNILKAIINNNWSKNNINLGLKTSSCENYDIYWNNGYKIRTIDNKIFNIVFLKSYKEEVLENIKTGMTNDEIKSILGNPTYENNSEFEIIGYKLENIYACFSEGEISIYRLDDYNEENNKAFAKLVTKLFKDKDYNTFLSELTKLYPDYSRYTQETDYVNIKYPLRGFEITFGNRVNSGITIYSNFKGNITEDISIDNVKENKKLPPNTYLKIDKNLVFEEEVYRAIVDLFDRAPYDVQEFEKGKFAQSSNFSVYYNETYQEYTFYSKNRDNPDFEIRAQNATGIYFLTNNIFAYGIKNNGIYIIDATTMQSSKIANSSGECIINKIENETIYYDNTSIQIAHN